MAAGVLVLVLLLFLISRIPEEVGPSGEVGVPMPASESETPSRPESAKSSGKAAWAFQHSTDLQADAATFWGELSNGFRYVIHPHSFPADRISMRLLVEAGSLMEEGDQRGVAHFVEHMAFNGSRHFPPEESFKRFQRLGLKTGADLNAHTSFDHTLYKLDLPHNDLPTIKEGLLFLRDAADGISFIPEEVEKERLVVLAERAEYEKSHGLWVNYFQSISPESILSERLPIGTKEAVSAVPRQRLLDFYQSWYAANRMVLVVAGDLDMEEMKNLIIAQFSSMEALERRPEPDIGTVVSQQGVTFSKSVPSGIKLMAVHPIDHSPDSLEKRRRRLWENIADEAVDARPNLGFLKSRQTRLANAVSIRQLSLTGYDQYKWREYVRHIGRTWLCFRDKGFTNDEFEIARTEVLRDAVKEMRASLSNASESIAEDIVKSILAREVHLSPLDRYNFVRRELPLVSLSQVEDAWRSHWDSPHVCLQIYHRTEVKDNEDPLDYLIEGWETESPKPAERVKKIFRVETPDYEGKIVSRTENPDTGVVSIQFENQVRLHLKRLLTVPEVVDVHVSFGSGKHSIPSNKPGIDQFAEYIFDEGGIGDFSEHELTNALSGKIVDCSLSVEESHFQLKGMTTSIGLSTQLRLMYGRLTNNHWQDLEDWRLEYFERRYRESYDSQKGHAYRSAWSVLRPGDARFIQASPDDVVSRNAAEVEEWLRIPFSESALEVSIVGDFKMESAIKLVAGTFGALPPREVYRQVTLAPPRRAASSDSTMEYEATAKHKEHSTVLRYYWPFPLNPSLTDSTNQFLLSAVLKNRLFERLREELGLTYSPSTHIGTTDDEVVSVLVVTIKSTEENAADVDQALMDVIAAIADKGITQDELDRARRPLLEHWKVSQKSPDFWIKSLRHYHSNTAEARLLLEFEQQMSAASVPAVNTAARLTLQPDKTIRHTFLPVDAP